MLIDESPWDSLEEGQQMNFMESFNHTVYDDGYNETYAEGAAKALERASEEISGWGAEPWNKFSPVIALLVTQADAIRKHFDIEPEEDRDE